MEARPMPPRILIVEDELIVAADLEGTLQDLGYEVVAVADTARNAMREVKKHRPDLVLMDIQLKEKTDGVTTADEIAKSWQIPVVFLTANTNDDVFARARSASPFGYLIKPFRAKELNATLLVALQQHRRTQQLFSQHAWLHTILDSISDGVLATDATGQIQYLNPVAEQLTGYTSAMANGKRIRELFTLLTPAGEPVEKDELQQVLEEGTTFDKQRFLLVKQDGRAITVEKSAAPIIDGARIAGAVCAFRDITQRLREEKAAADKRARLEGQVQATTQALGRTRAELRDFSSRLITAQEDERRNIAHELHDDFGQRTALLDLEAENVARFLPAQADAHRALQAMRAHITGLSEGLRAVSHRLHPSVISDLGLLPGLRSLIEDFRSAGMDVTLRSNVGSVNVPVKVATALYRVAQEAMVNCAKHCSEVAVHMTLSETEGNLQMTIADNGPGFDLALARAKRGLGILSMAERARSVGGTLLLRSAPGESTQVTVQVPLKPL